MNILRLIIIIIDNNDVMCSLAHKHTLMNLRDNCHFESAGKWHANLENIDKRTNNMNWTLI